MKNIILKILLITLVFSCNTLEENVKPNLKIGYVGSLSGPLDKYAQPILEAIELVSEKFYDEFNIEIIIKDDQGNPDLAQIVAKELVESDVDFVIGHTTSTTTKLALPIYNKNNILCITTSGSNPNINDSNFNNFISTLPNDYMQSKKIIEFIENKKTQNIYVVYDTGNYARNIVDGIKNENLNLNINYIIADIKNSKIYEEKDNSEPLDQFISKTDIIVYCGYYLDFENIYSFFRNQLNYDKIFIGSDGVHENGLFEKNTNIYYLTYTSNPDDFLNKKEVRNIIENYINRTGEEPGPFFERSYMTIDLLLNILKENKELLKLNDKDKVNSFSKLLKSKSHNSIYGEISFNEFGYIEQNNFLIYKVENDGFTLEY